MADKAKVQADIDKATSALAQLRKDLETVLPAQKPGKQKELEKMEEKIKRFQETLSRIKGTASRLKSLKSLGGPGQPPAKGGRRTRRRKTRSSRR